MKKCPACQYELHREDRFCPACGVDCDATVVVDPDATIAADPAAAPSPPQAGDRFVPGRMIADRYRIVGLLGRGGMGEVYRADDLKLGQPVALKFLPQGLESDPDRRERFLSEVRTARQVTHPNVCRVYDIDEVDGQHFLSMEYVDGEDLSSLLLRIGRLPEERAVEVARQICAGLAAAHDQGILHRDLKPANVMIDGRGRVRLTDFGLAGLADQIKGREIGLGTPAYMAPEQIAGREVSVRSDLYALGLVLYELFTGKRTFEARTQAEMQQMHTSAQPSHLTQYVTDLDPAVERVVLQCLEKNPADRPVSALAVSAALPGGDPLAAALAAGETPAPELVAQAGERKGLRPGRALLLAFVGLLILVAGTRWAGSLTITNYVPLDKRPAVLVDRARGMLDQLGYREEVYTNPVDQAWGFFIWNSVIQEVAATDTSGNPALALSGRTDVYSFWYRQAPIVLRPNPVGGPVLIRGVVGMINPSPITPGEVTVLLDGAGRLRRLEVMPTRYSLVDSVAEPDWEAMFRLAGLDLSRFSEDRPRYQRFLAPDRRRAWVGTFAERPAVPLRVDAGSYEGRPVLFNVTTVASLVPLSTKPVRQTPGASAYLIAAAQPLLILLVVVLSIRVTLRNVQQGRADRRGALRFGALCSGLFLVGNALVSHALFTREWPSEIWPLIAAASFIGLASWALYSAAEPLGRQVWPTMFVSSSRLLSRPRVQWRDPLIGYSVLVGVIGGGILFLLAVPVSQVISPLWSGKPFTPLLIPTGLLQGQRQTLGLIVDQAMLLTFTLVFVVALILIRKVIRRRTVALLVTLLVWTLLNGASSGVGLVFGLLQAAIMLLLLLRWGVVAMIVSWVVLRLSSRALASDWSAWYGQSAVLILVVLAALTCYGVWAAIGARRET